MHKGIYTSASSWENACNPWKPDRKSLRNTAYIGTYKVKPLNDFPFLAYKAADADALHPQPYIGLQRDLAARCRASQNNHVFIRCLFQGDLFSERYRKSRTSQGAIRTSIQTSASLPRPNAGRDSVAADAAACEIHETFHSVTFHFMKKLIF